ncbi:hypothetical protein ACKA0G_24760 [Priestia megaterium]|uniref:hypothetical protein n=1 Tax=Priestia megaterium TaxID=1404 RepID=UPI00389D9172
MLNKKKIFIVTLIFLYSLIVHLNSYYVSIFSFILIVSTVLLKPKIGFYVFLVTIIVTPDLNVIAIYSQKILISHSIFLDTLGGMTIITITTISVFAISFVRNFNIQINKFIFCFIILPLIIPLYGIVTTDNFREYISAASYIITVLTMFYLLSTIKVETTKVIHILYVCLIIKMIDIVIFTTMLEGFTLVYWGSVAYLFPIVLLIKHSKRSSLFSTILILLVISNLIIFPARGRIALFLVILLIFIFSNTSIKKLAKVLTLLCVSMSISYIIVTTLVPDEVTSYAKWKIETANPTEEENKSASIRYIEFQNIILGSLHKGYPLIIGEGYGGYFVDKYVPFNISDLVNDGKGAAFKPEWIQSRQFYRPHTVLNILLLKAGILPTLVFFAGLFYLALKYCVLVKNKNEIHLLIGILPFIAFIMYTQKLQLIFGLILVLFNQYLVRKHN